MFSISNDDLVAGEWAEPGDLVHCKNCGGTHTLAAGTTDGKPNLVMLFYSCGEQSFLGALQQHLLPGVHHAHTTSTL